MCPVCFIGKRQYTKSTSLSILMIIKFSKIHEPQCQVSDLCLQGIPRREKTRKQCLIRYYYLLATLHLLCRPGNLFRLIPLTYCRRYSGSLWESKMLGRNLNPYTTCCWWTKSQTVWMQCVNLSFILLLVGISCVTMDTSHVNIGILKEEMYFSFSLSKNN